MNYNSIKKTIILILAGVMLGSAIIFADSFVFADSFELVNIKNWAIQLQNVDPDIIVSSGFQLAVMDYSKDGSEENKYSPEEIQKIKDSGVIPIAYLSIGEAEDYRFYWQWDVERPDWIGFENPEWSGNYAVRYWKKEWKDIVFSYLDKIIAQGFSGVYLDKIDEFEYWSNPDNPEIKIKTPPNEDFYVQKEGYEKILLAEKDAAKKMTDFITEIANYARGKTNKFYIIPQNGESLLKFDNGSLANIISGWAVEDLFYDGTKPIPMNIAQERIRYLDIISAKAKPVFSVDYVDNGSGYSKTNKKKIDLYRRKALNRKFIPYAARSDRKLDELNIIKGIQPETALMDADDLRAFAGRKVSIIGSISEVLWQHMVDPPKAYPKIAYLDIGSGQIVIYSKNEIKSDKKVKLYGTVIKVEGGGKGSKLEEIFTEYQFIVDRWEPAPVVQKLK